MKTQQGDRQPGWDPQQCCVQPLPPVLDGFSVKGTARHSGVRLCKCSCPREGTASAIARQTSPGVGITCFLEFLYDIFKRPWEICYMVMKKHKTIMSLPPLGGVDVAHTSLSLHSGFSQIQVRRWTGFWGSSCLGILWGVLLGQNWHLHKKDISNQSFLRLTCPWF